MTRFHSSFTRGAGALLALQVALLGGRAAAQPAEPPAEAPPQPPAKALPSPPEPLPPAKAPPAKPADRAAEAPAEAAPEAAEKEAQAAEPAAKPQPPIGNDEKRPVPDYDGRGDDPLTVGEVLIWIPRAIFYPIYAVAEYGIRWPLGKLTVALEEHDVPGILEDFFTFGPGNRFGLVPSGLIDFGLRPSIGLYFWGDDYLGKGHDIRSHIAFGGIDFYRGTLTHRYHFNEDQSVDAKFIYSHRPDWIFHGLGPQSLAERESRYTAQHIEGYLKHRADNLWRSSFVEIKVGVRDVVFKDRGCCDELAVGEAVAEGFYPYPDLFDDGYLVAHTDLTASFDTRKRRSSDLDVEGSDFVSPSGSGLKIQLRGGLAGGLRRSPPAVPDGPELIQLAKYGATVGGFWDIYQQRVVGLSLIGSFVDPLVEHGRIPFTELASLGGDGPMRGFLQGRLLDRSAVTARLEYRWPIWVYLDGTIHYSVGNVFGERLDGFEPDLLRQSFGFGFREINARDHTLELLLAFGTKPFREGGGVDAVRFVFGTSAGF